ncbi:tyrosine transporter TyrP [Myroides marinus]|uniref:Tyrosine-specific transport protein n=1 Tax=Myroides marinus TaxID=703342 RepID=A0A1H6VBA3_9FLAO|nr:aromatic amino acid transport family protein [Myroides marinus]MDM1369154.1 tyrosine transporter TyrP [Myroides marinus]MDM1372047.1 tyrosine transporter TyrP [Myroides marinus]MDM1375992.1 tyrosine transporter TyrP [Myroides marinus]MDM1379619.1 tyrosine transporter TyrP [Myroides marinus]MDM1383097.1 tyrosine transporter TyrP [Myroides marinus]
MQKIIGSILIVAGTTIGAGMLAMPIISASVGFTFMAFILFCIWFAMYYTAILLVDVYKYNPPTDGLNTLTVKYLGNSGAVVTAISMLVLMYALVSAYITGGGEILRTNLENWLDIEISSHISAFLFSAVFGSIIAFGTRVVDFSNKIVFSIKLFFLCIVMALLLPKIEAIHLQHMPSTSIPVLATIPVIFTSFGFYVVIPSLVKYLEGNIKQLKMVFLIGSITPLILYLVWELTFLGNLDSNTFVTILNENSKLDGLVKAVRQVNDSDMIRVSFTLFASAALLTSFWGVAMALKDYIQDLGKNKPLIKNTFSAMLLTFIPPLVFAIFYPDGFVIALGYASVPLVVLALIMPMLMLSKAQKQAGVKQPITQKIAFLFLWALSALIFLLQGLMVAEIIPAY